jgi:hypothetical protein
MRRGGRASLVLLCSLLACSILKHARPPRRMQAFTRLYCVVCVYEKINMFQSATGTSSSNDSNATSRANQSTSSRSNASNGTSSSNSSNATSAATASTSDFLAATGKHRHRILKSLFRMTTSTVRFDVTLGLTLQNFCRLPGTYGLKRVCSRG